MSNTRICVKQLPKHLTDKRFKEHFEKFGTVTDAKIIKKDGKSRLFGFIGFATEQSAKNALSLNGTFIDTSKILVETATIAGESTESRPWSKYSIGSSSNKRVTELEKEKEKKELKRKQDKVEQQQQQSTNKKQKHSNKSSLLDTELENDPEYKEFLNLVAPQANRKVWENDDKDIGKTNREEEEEEEDESKDNDKLPFSGKKKIELDHGKNKDLLVFEDGDGSDEEDLYEDMPAPKKQNKKDDVQSIINEKKKKEDSSVSDLDWLSKFRSNNDEIIEKNQTVYRDDEESEEESEESEDDKENKKNKMKIDDNQENKKEKKKDKKKKDNKKDEKDDDDDDDDVNESKIKSIKYFEHDYTKEDENVGESGRIFVRNLSYSTKEEDLEKVFSKFGKISEIHIPIDYDTKKSKGMAFILYLIPENAVQALNEMDGKVFQGRLIHVLPGKAAPAKQFSEGKENGGAEGLSSYKSEKEQKQKSASGSTHNWNALFMRSDAIVSSLAERYKMTQGQLLDPNQMDLAVRMTLMETHVINETKKFLEDQGVIVQDIGNKGCKRSNTVLLVKNIPFKTEESELDELFSKFGELSRVVLSPARTLALIEYIHPNEAKTGFKNLAYSKFHHVPLYLEWAPEGVFKSPAPPRPQKVIKKTDSTEKTLPVTTNDKKDNTETTKDKKEEKTTTSPTTAAATTKTTGSEGNQFVFIKNLNWKTSNETLIGKFKPLKDYVGVNIATKANPKNPSERLPCGFGFVEFSSKQGAYECIKKLNGCSIDGYEISLKLSDKNETKVQETNKRKELPDNSKQSKQNDGSNKPSSKIIIKNLPFESTTKEIRKLFTAYGEIQSVRIPKKPNGGHRGFGFVEFLTEEEAKNAMEALGNSHFYGRHLVLQYAEQDKNIDELREKANLDYEKIKNSKF
ncbi:hypothetical protein RB653_001019 [Dictyostelium firmibasis]|uniref:RRM domain-containing protein n=1 Tax=Dictyostelium firmibasis TaxID=79012 RepID=A0AAN7U395_9MYCE